MSIAIEVPPIAVPLPPAPADPPAAPGLTPPAVAPVAESDPDMFPRSYVENLRDEAAKERIKNKALEDALAKAKTPEDFEAAVADFRKENDVLRRKSIASDEKIPAAFAELLKGETEDELRAHAKALAAIFASTQPPPPPPPANPGGGLEGHNGGEKVLPTNAGELADHLVPRRHF